MTTQKQERISIDNVPSKVADSIAEHLFSTTHIKASGLRKRIPGEEGREAVAIRTCNFTLRSLTLVSKKGSKLWIKYLLRHVRLDVSILAGFVSLVKRDPGLASFIQSLTLSDCPSFKPVPYERTGADRAKEYLKKDGFPEGFLSQLRPGQITATAAENRNWKSAKELAKFLPRPIDANHPYLENYAGFPEENALITGIVAHSVARILKHASNLQSLSVNGIEVYFPFCERIGKDARPFSSFTSSLTVLSFRKWEYIHPVITCKNVIWFLLNLPSLQKASFYANLDDSDVKFIKDHREAISKDHGSRVGELELDILDHVSDSNAGPLKEVEAPIAIKNLLSSCTRKLIRFSLRYEDFEFKGRKLDISVLKGLHNSFDSLQFLKIEWMSFHPDSKKNLGLLRKFTALEKFSSDRFYFTLLDQALLKTPETDPAPFSSSLKEIQMSCNCDKDFSEKGAKSLKERKLPPSIFFFSRVVKRLSTSSLERASTSALPIDHHGNLCTNGVYDDKKYEDARETLLRVCAESGIELTLVEEEF